MLASARACGHADKAGADVAAPGTQRQMDRAATQAAVLARQIKAGAHIRKAGSLHHGAVCRGSAPGPCQNHVDVWWIDVSEYAQAT